ncbi:MAG: GntG family PLP-dependent aldolase [Chloroflexi bacterium]|nr:GntG family PLP-dependent aldolase [Chloroflexota bacterium]
MIRVDLRSDTVSHPSPEMRKAMYEAELGDDVYGDDPTTNALEAKAAEMLGKEAAVFVTSGTQSNLVAILAQAGRGDTILVGTKSHILNAEAGGASALGGVVIIPIAMNKRGTMDADAIRQAAAPRDHHKAPVSLLCLENTQNVAGGTALTPEEIKTMADAGREHGLRVHVDGARIFNAAVALEIPVAALATEVDTIGFCLSKGLACPIGGILAGDADVIVEARRWRKMLGAGMRQVGVIAAAGIVALDTMVDRMADDHANARKIGNALAEMPGIVIDLASVETNIVRFGVPMHKGNEIAARLKAEGVLINGGDSDLRMVPHYGIDSEDVNIAINAMDKVMAEVAG